MKRPTVRWVAAVGALAAAAMAQPIGTSPLTPPPNGPRHADATWHAFTGATVHVSPERTVEEATVVIRDRRIVSVGEGAAPEGARVWDCAGLHIYPGFIDAYVEVEAPEPDRSAPGVHWNTRVTPQRSALDGRGVDEKTAESLRKLGFAAAAIAPRGGVFRGSGAVVSLAKDGTSSADRPPVYRREAYQSVAFESSRGGRGERETPDSARWSSYPNSQTGAIALIRQTLIDADWQVGAREAGAVIAPNALDSLAGGSDGAPLLTLFDTEDELEALRAAKIAREFERPAVILGSGTEFRRLDAIAEDGMPIVLPLRFPRAPDVATVGKAESVELRELMTWEQAPTNPRRLDAAGVKVMLTTAKLRRHEDFEDNLRRAMRHGLKPERALAMLTTHPAEVLGVADRLGTIETGKQANLVVAEGALFEAWPHRAEPAEAPPAEADGEENEEAEKKKERGKRSRVREVWIDGLRHEVSPPPEAGVHGIWKVVAIEGKAIDEPDDVAVFFTVSERGEVVYQRAGKTEKASNVRISGGRLEYTIDAKKLFDIPAVLIDSGVVEGDLMHGITPMPSGKVHRWTARRVESLPGPQAGEGAKDQPEKPGAEGAAGRGERRQREPRKDAEREEREAIASIPEAYGYPFGPYMVEEFPDQGPVLLRNATIWTCGPEGTIESGWVILEGGRIRALGSGTPPAADGAKEIDATGKHITPGIIDCHSHTGISKGINESGQAVTAEVRMGDVTDPDAISWYRQLAAGVTAVNTLHGSANAIGGQNQVNKVRWGVRRPDQMHFEGAAPGIKFALGENPKQSNWGDRQVTRYPQTRMGVEMIIRDRFEAAREYSRERLKWELMLDNMRFPTGGILGEPAIRRSAAEVKAINPAFASFSGIPHRRDLELEALAEVIEGKRLVHCHSYRQDEILMLCRVAQEFGFQIGTFQHVLEGYKVADEIAKAARGASAFSDWWAYKIEVQDAIPHNGPIMTDQGVCVSFNSDSDELARRLNTEAAKAVKYGGLPPEEALKYVTLNPAKQLGVEARVGSLEAGKDADLAVWSGPPLSAFSRCEATYVDGRELFSLERDREHRTRIQKERARLVQKALKAPKDRRGEGSRPSGRGLEGPWYRPADRSRQDMLERHYLDILNRGGDPTAARPGECGCGVEH